MPGRAAISVVSVPTGTLTLSGRVPPALAQRIVIGAEHCSMPCSSHACQKRCSAAAEYCAASANGDCAPAPITLNVYNPRADATEWASTMALPPGARYPKLNTGATFESAVAA